MSHNDGGEDGFPNRRFGKEWMDEDAKIEETEIEISENYYGKTLVEQTNKETGEIVTYLLIKKSKEIH